MLIILNTVRNTVFFFFLFFVKNRGPHMLTKTEGWNSTYSTRTERFVMFLQAREQELC